LEERREAQRLQAGGKESREPTGRTLLPRRAVTGSARRCVESERSLLGVVGEDVGRDVQCGAASVCDGKDGRETVKEQTICQARALFDA
jgi:hypothetical protein